MNGPNSDNVGSTGLSAARQASQAGRDRSTRPPAEGRLSNWLIRASAGTGKTFQLSNRYLQLILTGHSPATILATTFTRKAAGEILDRIAYRLATAAVNQPATDKLADELSLTGLSHDDCCRTLQSLTSQLHRLRIGTLDSFFLKATQSLSLELGLPPGWTICEELEDLQMQSEAIASTLESDDHKMLIQLLSWLAQGQTTRGVYRMLNDAVTQMYQTYLDSNQAAWHRIRPRKSLPDEQLDEILVGWDNWQAPAGSDKRLAKAVSKLRALAVAGKWSDVVSETLVQRISNGELTYYRKPIPPELQSQILKLKQQAEAEVVNRIQRQTEASYQLLDRYHQHYQSLKLQRRALRFSDLARSLIPPDSTHNAASHSLSRLAFRMDARIDNLLLDEFQDTSLDQWRVLLPFARHASAPQPARSFFCVGDVKQAIYGWRGGNADLLDTVSQQLEGIEEQKLDRSFRSSPVIVDLVNQVNVSMVSYPKLKRAESAVRHWCERFPKHDTARTDLPGYVSLETSAWTQDQHALRNATVKSAVNRVAALRACAPDQSIAVLVRTNELVGKVIYALQMQGIAASEEGGNPLTDSAAVQLILSRLQLADYPHDTASLFHLRHSPWAHELGLDVTCEQTEWQLRSAANALASTTHTALADWGYGRTITRWAQQLRPFCNAREARRLEQIVELAYSYQYAIETPRAIGQQHQHREPLRSVGFIELVNRHRVADPTDAPVRVMNIHQSKGLQFDCVILPELERKLVGQVPTCVTRRRHPAELLDTVVRYVKEGALDAFPEEIREVHNDYVHAAVREELCVLYVALTRAVHCLHMIVEPTVEIDESTCATSNQENVKQQGKSKPRGSTENLAGLIRHALDTSDVLPPETIVYEKGDPHWWRPSGASSPSAGRKTSTLWQSLSTSDSSESPSRTNQGGDLVGKPSAEERRWNRIQRLAGSITHESTSPTDETSTAGASAPQPVRQRQASQPVRPSALEGGGRVSLAKILGTTSQQAMLRGTLIHAFFEQVDWLDEGMPDDRVLQQLALSSGAKEVEIRAAIRDFKAMLARPNTAQLLSRTAYSKWLSVALRQELACEIKVYNEQRVSVWFDESWVNGSIDRLVLLMSDGHPSAADIIDFKTDRIENLAQVNQLVEHYRPQLSAYRRGLHHMLQLPVQKIRTQLLLLDTDQVVTVHDHG